MTFAGALLVPADAAAPPDQTWGPMLVVALVVVAVVALIVGFGRITRRPGRGEDTPGRPDDTTTSDDPLPTDPPEGHP
ncbi:hypothetical protein ACFQU3_10435 [Terrabacter sp. GCM10028922]|uniref:hypothetical protein n=1 Tax=Terrabacter sp. GCM10028922 TaxID=3273428 RepID=UPI00361D1DED